MLVGGVTMAGVKAYLTLGVITACLALGATALWYRGQAISAQAQAAQARLALNTAVAANKVQEETIGRLRASAAANDRIMAGLTEQLAFINASITETNQQIGDLKDANEDVRAYLSGLVPAELKRVLDR